jgi:CDP-2,3-bis-(O-geranylgeranyl)-sn-glycerol synthase
MGILLLSAAWFIAPAMVSNMMPVVASKYEWLRALDRPIDHKRTFNGRRIFGNHKTYRGYVVGVSFAILTALLQYALADRYAFFRDLELLDAMTKSTYIVLGFMLGFGELTGDAIKSFFKRQFDIKPGQSWFPYDQLDYIVGALIFALPFGHLLIVEYAAVFAVGFGLHLITTAIGYVTGFRDAPI